MRPDRAHQAVDGRHPGLTRRAGAAVAALAVLAGACSATAQRLASTSLTIEVRASEGAAPTGYTLACDPAGGTLPGAAEACDRLAASGAPFAPLPADAVCTQVYGGPEVATVRGVFRGQAVDAVFTRRNGCEIARYARLMRTLGLR